MGRTWLSRSAFAILAMGFVAALLTATAQANDVLRLRMTSQNGGLTYHYRQFSNAGSGSYTVQSGDYVEYDVYAQSNRTGVGGVDVYSKRNGTTYAWRDQAGWADQNGITGHPGADLRSRAYNKWYHRKLAVPSAMVGTVIDHWTIALSGDGRQPWDVDAAMFDNVCITRAGTSVLWAYQDGTPSLNVTDLAVNTQSTQLFYGTARKPSVQTAAHFFFWYGFPDPLWVPNIPAEVGKYPYKPHGCSPTAIPPYDVAVWDGYGNGYPGLHAGYYSSRNQYWYEAELQDMKRAGVDIALVCSWGEVPVNTAFKTSYLQQYLVPALERSGSGVKVAMMDASYSQAAEWNYYNPNFYFNGQPDGLAYTAYSTAFGPTSFTGQDGRTHAYPEFDYLDVNNSNTWWYFYGGKIRPFFQAIPQKFWATHNGLPVEQGGRPIICLYLTSWFKNVNLAGDSLLNTIKTLFAQDFTDRYGYGITPYIITDCTWWNDGCRTAPDSIWAWQTETINGANGYYCSEVSPGWDNRLNDPLNGTVVDRLGGRLLTSRFNTIYTVNASGGPSVTPATRQVWDTNLMMVETWNELWEGTGVMRAGGYLDVSGQPTLAETSYIDQWRSLIAGTVGIRDLDATFLQTWKIPTTLTRGTTTGQVVQVRNDGFTQWDTSGAYQVNLAGWLEDANGNMIPNTTTFLGYISAAATTSQTTTASITTPANWPTGSYYLRLDVITSQTGQWFHNNGDTPARIPVTID